MYISQLSISGYKNAHISSKVSFHKGLNILLGENGCGKTAVINSLRLLFREPESIYSCSSDDFYCSLDRTIRDDTIKIDASFSELSEDEKIVFLSWCDADFNAQLHLLITENKAKPGSIKRRFWGGKSMSSIFEEDTFDRVECIYLPPLRDAEAKLSAGKRSRLSLLLKKKYGNNTQSLVDSVSEFNNDLVRNRKEIQEIKSTINEKMNDALGAQLSQSVNLLFSEASFSHIVENIRLVFFPHINESDINKFRDLATNSLGYNNLLYIATVFSELELIKNTDVFTILLIEEPEAHLHPQLQVKFIKYIQSLAESLPNAQIIVSTHSPVLSSSVDINKLIHIAGYENRFIATSLANKKYDNNGIAEKYINRWMDITKSTMLFSRGIILVEGIAEALLIPKFAEAVLKEYNSRCEEEKRIASTLDEMGISVININGINFKYFMKLFGNFDNAMGPCIPIFCSGITDRDPETDAFPMKNENPVSTNPIADHLISINDNEWLRLYMSPLKTLEYDLSIYNPVTMATVLKTLWPTQDGDVVKQLDKIIDKKGIYDDNASLTEDSKYIYTHIDCGKVGKGIFAHTLAEMIPDEFIVPCYIKEAILWACGGITE